MGLLKLSNNERRLEVIPFFVVLEYDQLRATQMCQCIEREMIKQARQNE